MYEQIKDILESTLVSCYNKLYGDNITTYDIRPIQYNKVIDSETKTLYSLYIKGEPFVKDIIFEKTPDYESKCIILLQVISYLKTLYQMKQETMN